ncbi:MAG: response regulator transcription factor [Hyphomicrobiaceae bacterium]
MRLLLIEDNATLSQLMAQGLTRAGFAVDAFVTGADGLHALSDVAYDLLVLDLGLPDIDGAELLAQIRARGLALPVIMVTARGGVDDRIAGLNLGADDYLVKPFEMEELVARCRALLRRPGGRSTIALNVGNVELDTVTGELRIGDAPVEIGRREFEILLHLARHAGRVVPKTRLEEALYRFGEEVTPNAIEAHVSRLRKRFAGSAATASIHTVRGIGYLMKG